MNSWCQVVHMIHMCPPFPNLSRSDFFQVFSKDPLPDALHHLGGTEAIVPQVGHLAGAFKEPPTARWSLHGDAAGLLCGGSWSTLVAERKGSGSMSGKPQGQSRTQGHGCSF